MHNGVPHMAKTKTTNINDLVNDTQPEVVKATNHKVKLVDYFINLFGTTPNFSHINPVNTFDNRWRVNVYTMTEGFIKKFTIHKSFFVIVEKGEIITNPKI
jgi:hypothetical protein